MKKYRIKSKFRFTLFLVIAILLSASMFSSFLGLNNVNSISLDEFKPVKVEAGESLWSIAKANNPNNKDIRSLIHEIKKINELESSEINEGQKILIPVNK